MEPELASLLVQFESVSADAKSLTKRLNDSQLLWKPGASKWSVAECFAHLIAVESLDLPDLRQAIADGRENGVTGTGPFRYGIVSGWFLRSLEPPVKRSKSSAPGAYVPGQVTDPRATIAKFFEIQAELRDLIRSSDGLHLARVKTRLPALPAIRMSIGRRFQTLAAHDRRHLWQAHQVVNLLEPRAASGTTG